MIKYWKSCLSAVALSFLALGVAQASLSINTSRVIYPEGKRDQSVMLINTGEQPLLLQVWLDRGEGDVVGQPTPFAVMPAVLLLSPDTQRAIRVVYDGQELPADRESVYWLNLHQISPKNKGADGQKSEVAAALDIAVNLQIKVFYRPAALAPIMVPESAAKSLRFSIQNQGSSQQLLVHNPTPYHVSFGALSLKAGEVEVPATWMEDMMVKPFSDRVYSLEGTLGSAQDAVVTYNIISDTGIQHSFQSELERKPI